MRCLRGSAGGGLDRVGRGACEGSADLIVVGRVRIGERLPDDHVAVETGPAETRRVGLRRADGAHVLRAGLRAAALHRQVADGNDVFRGVRGDGARRRNLSHRLDARAFHADEVAARVVVEDDHGSLDGGQVGRDDPARRHELDLVELLLGPEREGAGKQNRRRKQAHSHDPPPAEKRTMWARPRRSPAAVARSANHPPYEGDRRFWPRPIAHKVRHRMANSKLRIMSQEAPKPADLSALRIRREPESRSGARGWLLFGAVLVVAAGVAAYFLADRGLGPKKVEVVTASVVTEGQATTVLSATGYVEAERKADLSPKITSRITALNVTEGTRVKKGDVIARLDSTDLDAQLAEAKANWINAQAELIRQKSLFDQGLSTKSALDAAVANEAATHARVRYVEALLDYTIIRAPFAGVITAKRAFVGEAVSPFGSSPSGGGSGGAIATIVEFSSLYVGADVNEANLSKLAPQPAGRDHARRRSGQDVPRAAAPDRAGRGPPEGDRPGQGRLPRRGRPRAAGPVGAGRLHGRGDAGQGGAVARPDPEGRADVGRREGGRLPDRRRESGVHGGDRGRRRSGSGGSHAGPAGRRAPDLARGRIAIERRRPGARRKERRR